MWLTRATQTETITTVYAIQSILTVENICQEHPFVSRPDQPGRPGLAQSRQGELSRGRKIAPPAMLRRARAGLSLGCKKMEGQNRHGPSLSSDSGPAAGALHRIKPAPIEGLDRTIAARTVDLCLTPEESGFR